MAMRKCSRGSQYREKCSQNLQLINGGSLELDMSQGNYSRVRLGILEHTLIRDPCSYGDEG